ncbi:hypothetical protein QR680_014494 [Steinernema hermaphroditum]|uniref:Uncharacterized protein n=1 Tax=Steinernema hermaphroditum TaxID=289476 RepID=A0AA39M400_9BILA|nr:hypothetical protein QR680_014494 [Steinernema hermaphroditum]
MLRAERHGIFSSLPPEIVQDIFDLNEDMYRCNLHHILSGIFGEIAMRAPNIVTIIHDGMYGVIPRKEKTHFRYIGPLTDIRQLNGARIREIYLKFEKQELHRTPSTYVTDLSEKQIQSF